MSQHYRGMPSSEQGGSLEACSNRMLTSKGGYRCSVFIMTVKSPCKRKRRREVLRSWLSQSTPSPEDDPELDAPILPILRSMLETLDPGMPETLA